MSAPFVCSAIYATLGAKESLASRPPPPSSTSLSSRDWDIELRTSTSTVPVGNEKNRRGEDIQSPILLSTRCILASTQSGTSTGLTQEFPRLELPLIPARVL